ncbi:MAG: bacteriohemerythrin, partial [Pseudomonadota bacterium]
SVGSKVLDVLKQGEFFGEEGAIFKVPHLSHLHVLDEAAVVQIPGDLLKNVPILRWKLFEKYQRRMARVIHRDDRMEVFIWNDAFSIQVAQMDSHHKRLVDIANTIIEHLHADADHESLVKALDALVDYTHYHFSAEEKLMALYDYSGADVHRKKHANLIDQGGEYWQGVLGGSVPDKASFLHFFRSWILRHILDEDRKYGAFLNAKGVY